MVQVNAIKNVEKTRSNIEHIIELPKITTKIVIGSYIPTKMYQHDMCKKVV